LSVIKVLNLVMSLRLARGSAKTQGTPSAKGRMAAWSLRNDTAMALEAAMAFNRSGAVYIRSCTKKTE
jgi:hypothetical protein